MTQINFPIIDYDKRSILLKEMRMLGAVGQDWSFFIGRRGLTIVLLNDDTQDMLSWIMLKYGSDIKVMQ